jgi:hypothetical protein
MASLVLNGNTSGSITISSPAVSGTTTLTLPISTGTVMVNGPAFSAYASSTLSVTTSVATKVQINTEEFDTNSNYDNATNYRFTPTVAGYYQVTAQLGCSGTGITVAFCAIYKNGSLFKRGTDIRVTNTYSQVGVNNLIYLNGSTDYLELYGTIAATSPSFSSGSDTTYFQAAMVRGA